jgi:hypothetical protein
MTQFASNARFIPVSWYGACLNISTLPRSYTLQKTNSLSRWHLSIVPCQEVGASRRGPRKAANSSFSKRKAIFLNIDKTVRVCRWHFVGWMVEDWVWGATSYGFWRNVWRLVAGSLPPVLVRAVLLITSRFFGSHPEPFILLHSTVPFVDPLFLMSFSFSPFFSFYSFHTKHSQEENHLGWIAK